MTVYLSVLICSLACWFIDIKQHQALREKARKKAMEIILIKSHQMFHRLCNQMELYGKAQIELDETFKEFTEILNKG